MALTLDHKAGSRITLTHGGEEMIITVIGTRRGAVKLRFDGPRSFDIHREGAAPKREKEDR